MNEIRINLEQKKNEKTKKVTFSFYPETEEKLEKLVQKLEPKGGKSALIRSFVDDVYQQLFNDDK